MLMLSVATAILAAPLVGGMIPREVRADGSVEINEENFPDEVFRNYVATDLDKTPGDGELTSKDISSIDTIVLINKGVKSLKGIEFFPNLINLRCDKNELTSIDVSQNPELDYLNCARNQITSINFGDITKLTQLHCFDNRLTELSLSNLKILKEFDCGTNSIASLDLSNLPELFFLNCDNNLLTSLNITNDTKLKTMTCKFNLLKSLPTGKSTCTSMTTFINSPQMDTSDYRIALDRRFFPDVKFVEWLASQRLDTNSDGYLSDAELNGLSEIDVSVSEITSLDGIRYFPSLQYLFCEYTGIKELDLSGLANLEKVNASSSAVESLNVSGCMKLKYLHCRHNALKALDLSSCPALVDVDVSDNKITSLKVEGLEKLETFMCEENELTSLTVKNNPKLIALDCNKNKLTSLPIENCPKLANVECISNQLTSCPVLDASAARMIDCSSNPIETLDVSAYTGLTRLLCSNTQITELDLTGLSELFALDCSNTKLQELDCFDCEKLYFLTCNNCNLVRLSTSNCPNLSIVKCQENYLPLPPVVPDSCVVAFEPQNDALFPRENFRVSSATNNMVTLSWTKAFFDGTWFRFKIYRSEDPEGEFEELGMTTESYFEDRLVVPEKTYYYKMCCTYERSGITATGEFTDVVQTKTKANTPTPTNTPTPIPKPAKPANVKATAESSTSINVSWNAVADATGYQVWRSTSANGTFNSIGTYTTTSKLSTGLTANTTYYYKVRAYRDVNGKKLYGDYSAVVRAETLLAKPAGVKAASTSGTSVTVSWNAVAGAAGYQVWRSTSSTGTFNAVGSVTTTSRACTALTTGTTYYFKVRAYKEVNGKKIYGDYSAVVNAVPKLVAPSNVKAVPDTATGIKISWSAVSGATGYQVWRATSATGTFTAIGSVTTTNRVSTGLKAGTTYYYKVRAYKEVNGTKVFGAYSTIVSSMPKPAAPAGVKATVSSATKITVNWNAVTGATGYEVYRATAKDGTYSKLGTVTTTSRACPGLTTGTTYYFKVRSYVEVNGTKYYSGFSTVVSETPKK